ncbi:MAG: hypothetical protein CM1200mP20_01930 [Pseudomonadota bacterium]|nr:MAG: hypothetical protein CM1200mP20_01930 [Pseudomonadota bacterium]
MTRQSGHQPFTRPRARGISGVSGPTGQSMVNPHRMTIAFKPIAQCAGTQPFAECSGVDLSADLSTQAVETLRAGLLQHGLLLFREQNALSLTARSPSTRPSAGMIPARASFCSALAPPDGTPGQRGRTAAGLSPGLRARQAMLENYQGNKEHSADPGTRLHLLSLASRRPA